MSGYIGHGNLSFKMSRGLSACLPRISQIESSLMCGDYHPKVIILLDKVRLGEIEFGVKMIVQWKRFQGRIIIFGLKSIKIRCIIKLSLGSSDIGCTYVEQSISTTKIKRNFYWSIMVKLIIK